MTRRLAWLLMLVAGGAMAVAATAAASNFGPINNQIYFANGSKHKFNFNNLLSDSWRGASNWVRKNEIGPTHMTTAVVDSHSAADVVPYDADYGDSGWCGMADCTIEKTNRVCQHFHVKYNTANGIGCPNDYTETQRRSLACEEIGHTVGLQHRHVNAGCMSQAWDRTHFTPHDKRHINRRY
jgi:hypothetical protein